MHGEVGAQEQKACDTFHALSLLPPPLIRVLKVACPGPRVSVFLERTGPDLCLPGCSGALQLEVLNDASSQIPSVTSYQEEEN